MNEKKSTDENKMIQTELSENDFKVVIIMFQWTIMKKIKENVKVENPKVPSKEIEDIKKNVITKIKSLLEGAMPEWSW